MLFLGRGGQYHETKDRRKVAGMEKKQRQNAAHRGRRKAGG
jgi:hypothetical protein